MRPSVRPDAAPQFQPSERGQRPRPWSSTPQESSPKSYVRSPSRTVPVAGRAVCLEVYWKRRSSQGTTTDRVS